MEIKRRELTMKTEAEVIDGLVEAVKAGLRLFDKDHALSRFDWRKSFLRAQDVQELNETPIQMQKALDEWKKRFQ
jgi:hypothetical protein